MTGKKAKKTIVKPASWAHPWKQPAVTPKTAKAPRVTRPLPSHLQSVAPPPVAIEEPLIATTPVVTHEPPLDAPQTDLDAALIDALKHVLPAMQRAAADLPKSIETTTEEAWQRTLDINITAVWRMSRLVIPHMRTQGKGIERPADHG